MSQLLRFGLHLRSKFLTHGAYRPVRNNPAIIEVVAIQAATLEPRTRAYAGGFRTFIK